LVVTRKDGSRITIKAGRTSHGTASEPRLILSVWATSARLDWAIVECSTPDGIKGSLAGSISTFHVLVSVAHRRVFEPEDIGFAPGAYFLDFERKGAIEVMSYTTVGEHGSVDRTMALSELGRLAAEQVSSSKRAPN
jgi:hypothetical protein